MPTRDVATQTESDLTTTPSPARLISRPVRKTIAQGRSVTRVFGFKLDAECISRWGREYFEIVFPGELSTMSKKKARRELRGVRSATLNCLARNVYAAVPSIPRLERNIVMLNLMAGTFVFVFKDNSSHAALHAPVSSEDMELAKEFVGVPNEPLRWYKVKLYWYVVVLLSC